MKWRSEITNLEMTYKSSKFNFSILDPINNILTNRKELDILSDLKINTIIDFLIFDPIILITDKHINKKYLENILNTQSTLLACFDHTRLVKRLMQLKNASDNNITKMNFLDAIDLLSNRAKNRINNLNIRSVEEISALTTKVIFGIDGAGLKTWFEIRVLKDILKIEKDLLTADEKDSAIGVGKTNNASNLAKELALKQEYNSLSKKAKNVLNKIGINTFNDLMIITDYDYTKERDLAPCIRNEIDLLKQEVVEYSKWKSNGKFKPLNEAIKEPIKLNILHKLPVFSNIICDSKIEDFHETFCAKLKIDDLTISARAKNVISSIKINTLGELLLTQKESLLNCKNFGKVTLNDTQAAIEEYLINKTISGCVNINYVSFQQMFKSFLDLILKKERDKNILYLRIKSDHKEKYTYELIGDEFHLSRERVRQIVVKISKILQKQSTFQALNRFWDIINPILYENRIITLNDLILKLIQKLEWKEKPDFFQLRWVLSLNSNYIIDEENETIRLSVWACFKCNHIYRQLMDIVSSKQGKVPIKIALQTLTLFCSNQCNVNDVHHTEVNKLFLNYLISSYQDLVVEKGAILSYKMQLLKLGNRRAEVVKRSLEKIGKPTHYKKLAKFIRGINNKHGKISDQSVHSILISLDEFVYLGRGIYGLKWWDIKPKKTVGNAIIDLLAEKGYPLKAETIVNTLTRNDTYSKSNILITLGKHSKIVAVGHNLYTLSDAKQFHKTKPILEEKERKNELKLSSFVAQGIRLSKTQMALIQCFLDNQGSLSLFKIEMLSRKNNWKGTQLMNSLNQIFIEKYNQPLIKEENDKFTMNAAFLEV